MKEITVMEHSRYLYRYITSSNNESLLNNYLELSKRFDFESNFNRQMTILQQMIDLVSGSERDDFLEFAEKIASKWENGYSRIRDLHKRLPREWVYANKDTSASGQAHTRASKEPLKLPNPNRRGGCMTTCPTVANTPAKTSQPVTSAKSRRESIPPAHENGSRGGVSTPIPCKNSQQLKAPLLVYKK